MRSGKAREKASADVELQGRLILTIGKKQAEIAMAGGKVPPFQVISGNR